MLPGLLQQLRACFAPRPPGQRYEARALGYLRLRGFRLVARNYRCKGGELDLVVRRASLLLFVEVKYRSRGDYGQAPWTVTPCKQQRLRLAAAHFLQGHREFQQLFCRFDIVAFDRAGRRTRTTWLKAAFE